MTNKNKTATKKTGVTETKQMLLRLLAEKDAKRALDSSWCDCEM
jgi:hypothetical protein